MNSRERTLATLLFERPGRVPLVPGWPRESTLRAWRAQGLPESGDWLDHLHETIGLPREQTQPPVDLGVDFRLLPQFEEKVLEHADGHYIVQDWKGNVCEIADTFDVTYLRTAKDFVTRRWIRCPVETRDDWERMKERYDPEAPARFPADFAARCGRAKRRDDTLEVFIAGPFWQMREWVGFERLCTLLLDDPDFAADMAAFHADFVSAMLEKLLAGVVPDAIHLTEDMAYKGASMISPAMVRRFIQPAWTRWASQARAAGCPIVDVDSDGFIGELIPLWIESGVNVCDPVEVAAGNDINEFRRRFGRKMAYTGGVDKRAIAKGGRVIRGELKRLDPVVRDGGFIPSCDHGVPSDVSWPNFVDYSRELAKITGNL